MFRKTVQAMEGYVPGEQPRDRRTVKLNTNENPYPPSPVVLEALRDALGEGLRLYPRPMSDELRERAARVYAVRPENVLVGNGSDDLLSMVARASIEPGVRVAYPVPTYSLYDTLVELHDGTAVRVPFEADFSLPPKLLQVDARVIFLANPNSPSGTLVPPDAVQTLAERQRKALVVVDEAYVDFADTNCLAAVKELPNVLVLRTLSKSFSLAGLRIGLAIGPERIIEALAKVKDSYNVNRLSAVAGAAALRDLRWMEANVRRIRRTRELLRGELLAMGFEVYPSQANFVLARRPGRDLSALHEGLRRRGVLVRYFPTRDLRDCLRITVGTDDEIRILLRVLSQLLRNEPEE
ncbi:MAG: histidinol-phosphate transaminase [Candidatus Binatia bacterium]